MPDYTIQAPNGQTYRISGPAGASDEDVRREVLRQHPQAGSPAAQAASQGPTDLIGQIKQRLIRDRPPGEATRFGESDLPGRMVRGVVPGSWPGLISTGISLVPGGGPLMAVARPAVSAATSAGIEAIRGGDPMAAGVSGGLQSLGGEVVGSLGRTGGRMLMSKLGPARMPERLSELVGRLVPAFRGPSGKATLQNILSGEGQKALGEQYRAAVDRALAQLPPGTLLSVPGLVQLGQKGTVSHMPFLFEAGDAMTRIASLQRSLSGVTGSLSRRKSALIEMSALDRAEEEFALALQNALPANSTASKMLAQADTDYARGKAIQRLIGSGRESLTPAQSGRFLDASDIERARMLEKSFLARMGELRKRFTPDEFDALAQTVRRGELDPLAVSQAGRTPMPRFHLGFVPTVHGLPHAPRPIGARETLTPEQIAEHLRLLGTRGVGTMMGQ